MTEEEESDVFWAMRRWPNKLAEVSSHTKTHMYCCITLRAQPFCWSSVLCLKRNLEMRLQSGCFGAFFSSLLAGMIICRVVGEW